MNPGKPWSPRRGRAGARGRVWSPRVLPIHPCGFACGVLTWRAQHMGWKLSGQAKPFLDRDLQFNETTNDDSLNREAPCFRRHGSGLDMGADHRLAPPLSPGHFPTGQQPFQLPPKCMQVVEPLIEIGNLPFQEGPHVDTGLMTLQAKIDDFLDLG